MGCLIDARSTVQDTHTLKNNAPFTAKVTDEARAKPIGRVAPMSQLKSRAPHGYIISGALMHVRISACVSRAPPL